MASAARVRSLNIRIKELDDQLAIRDQLHWEKPYYWLGFGDPKDGPYCQACYDSEKKLIRLQGGTGGQWSCRTCKKRVSGFKLPIAQCRGKRLLNGWFRHLRINNEVAQGPLRQMRPLP